MREQNRGHDAERLFEVEHIETQESSVCIGGQILRGLKKPHDYPAFGKQYTPQNPLGATMVSSEGACAAYHAYGRHLEATRRREPELVQIGGVARRPPTTWTSMPSAPARCRCRGTTTSSSATAAEGR